jgi:hypothetical protein
VRETARETEDEVRETHSEGDSVSDTPAEHAGQPLGRVRRGVIHVLTSLRQLRGARTRVGFHLLASQPQPTVPRRHAARTARGVRIRLGLRNQIQSQPVVIPSVCYGTTEGMDGSLERRTTPTRSRRTCSLCSVRGTIVSEGMDGSLERRTTRRTCSPGSVRGTIVSEGMDGSFERRTTPTRSRRTCSPGSVRGTIVSEGMDGSLERRTTPTRSRRTCSPGSVRGTIVSEGMDGSLERRTTPTRSRRTCSPGSVRGTIVSEGLGGRGETAA